MSDKGIPESKPSPDPTVLTTEQLIRESDRIEKLFKAELEGAQQKNFDRFESIKHEFDLIERHRVEQKKDTKDAVDAALQAAEKAVNKSELSFAEQSKQQRETFSASLKGVTDIMNDLKERVGKIENIKLGATETRDTQRLDMGTILAILSLAAVVVFALIR